METNDIDLDDIGALFMKNSSPNVTLGKYHVYIRDIRFDIFNDLFYAARYVMQNLL